MNYINNHYQTNLPHPTLNPYLNKIVLNSENLRIMGKWFNPDFRLEKKAYLRNKHSLDSLMIVSLYCKEYGLTEHYIETIDSFSQKGGYYLTHACIYYQWAKINGCLDNESNTKKLGIKLAQNLARHVRDTKELNDLDVEAIALLRFMDVKTPASDIYLTRLINNQMFDGGWQAFSNDKRSYNHTTALASWSLIDEIKTQTDEQSPFIDVKKLSPLELYTSYFLLSKLDSNFVIAPFDSLFIINNRMEYSGTFLQFNSAFDSLLKYYYRADELPKLEVAIENTSKLAYLFFYKSAFKNGNSNELLNKILLEISQKTRASFDKNLSLLSIKVLLEEKGLLENEKTELKNELTYSFSTLTEFQKVLFAFLTHYKN